MPRYRQITNPETGLPELVPLDDSARIKEGIPVMTRGAFEAFKSPIDGAVISNQREYDDHCKKHNVVPAAEFSPAYYAEKARERERFYNAEHSPAEKLKRKQELYENMIRAERGVR